MYYLSDFFNNLYNSLPLYSVYSHCFFGHVCPCSGNGMLYHGWMVFRNVISSWTIFLFCFVINKQWPLKKKRISKVAKTFVKKTSSTTIMGGKNTNSLETEIPLKQIKTLLFSLIIYRNWWAEGHCDLSLCTACFSRHQPLRLERSAVGTVKREYCTVHTGEGAITIATASPAILKGHNGQILIQLKSKSMYIQVKHKSQVNTGPCVLFCLFFLSKGNRAGICFK